MGCPCFSLSSALSWRKVLLRIRALPPSPFISTSLAYSLNDVDRRRDPTASFPPLLPPPLLLLSPLPPAAAGVGGVEVAVGAGGSHDSSSVTAELRRESDRDRDRWINCMLVVGLAALGLANLLVGAVLRRGGFDFTPL
jgi:hypothetical protein